MLYTFSWSQRQVDDITSLELFWTIFQRRLQIFWAYAGFLLTMALMATVTFMEWLGASLCNITGVVCNTVMQHLNLVYLKV